MTEFTNHEISNNCPYCGTKLPQGEFFCSSGDCSSPTASYESAEITNEINTTQNTSSAVNHESSKLTLEPGSYDKGNKVPEPIKTNKHEVKSQIRKAKPGSLVSSKAETDNSSSTKIVKNNQAQTKKRSTTNDTNQQTKTEQKKKSPRSNSLVSKQKPWTNHTVHRHVIKSKSAPNLFPPFIFLILVYTTITTLGFSFFSSELMLLVGFVTALIFIKLITDMIKWFTPQNTDLEWDKYTSWLFDETSSVVVAIDISVTSQKKNPYYVTVSLADENKNAVHKGLHVVYSNFNGKTHLREIFGQAKLDKKSAPIKRVAKCYWKPEYDPKTMVIELEDLVLFCRERDL